MEKAGFVATEYYTNGIELRLLVVRLSSISRENFFIPRRTVDTLYLMIEEAGFEAVGVYPITICMKLNLDSKRCEYILIWEINTQHDTWNSYRLRWKFHQNQRLALINKIEFEYWEHPQSIYTASSLKYRSGLNGSTPLERTVPPKIAYTTTDEIALKQPAQDALSSLRKPKQPATLSTRNT
ncbi:PWWP domain-containing family protein [Dorcoceras hygrometricum]|uniref:PWWP domain-containing family protein n=1 Tax=Dorcoceras hygrometricum TaxID=472368 RepID=A0A2Z7BNS8_9LAMI|nr:PWWP domain-containing family protein [Dorcoceras hygrometricum]